MIFCGTASAANVTVSSTSNHIHNDSNQNINTINYNKPNTSSNKDPEVNSLPDPRVIRNGIVVYSSTQIQDAVNHAVDGDTIEVDDGSIPKMLW
ncbi:MAG: hypothetical protein NKF70_13255 [Methanobacterium sp. ERen5]|nr:MAG: hypothetical protein NKF70_13255 [Methanobacterium sp. ERen5]